MCKCRNTSTLRIAFDNEKQRWKEKLVISTAIDTFCSVSAIQLVVREIMS